MIIQSPDKEIKDKESLSCRRWISNIILKLIDNNSWTKYKAKQKIIETLWLRTDKAHEFRIARGGRMWKSQKHKENFALLLKLTYQLYIHGQYRFKIYMTFAHTCINQLLNEVEQSIYVRGPGRRE
jgi:hypothetical protein